MLIPFILGQSYVLLLPLFVEQELDKGPVTFGALSACLGAGSVVGAMAVATFGKQRLIGLLMFAGILGTGVSAIAYGLSQWVPLTGAVLFVAGSAESALFAAYETLLLIRLPDEILGEDGYADLAAAGSLALTGLEGYHEVSPPTRLPYARPSASGDPSAPQGHGMDQ